MRSVLAVCVILSLLVAGLAVAQQAKKPPGKAPAGKAPAGAPAGKRPPKPTGPMKVYMCDKCGIGMAKAGNCPKCKAKLAEKEFAYQCPKCHKLGPAGTCEKCKVARKGVLIARAAGGKTTTSPVGDVYKCDKCKIWTKNAKACPVCKGKVTKA